MMSWLTPNVAVLLMLLGVLPSLVTLWLLYDEIEIPGVLWFLISMGTGAAWALTFALMTLIPSPEITLALANIFWTLIPIAAVTLFLLAYEFTFKVTINRQIAAVLFAPIGVFFILSWINPNGLVYASEYTVTSEGYLRFPQIGGFLRISITQIYGYMLVLFATGIFIGEAMRTNGIQRRQTIYLLLIFSTLIASTIVKITGYLPIYYDPTSTVYGFSGLLFAWSIHQNGFLRSIPAARSQTFNQLSDAILVVNDSGLVIDVNHSAKTLFGELLIGSELQTVLPEYTGETPAPSQIELTVDGATEHYAVQTATVDYGRGMTATTITLSNITQLKSHQKELGLLKEILSRMFRHNIRNDLTVVKGYTQQIIDRGDEETINIADDINSIVQHLEGQAKKAGKIEHIITNDDCVTKPLPKFLEEANFSQISGYEKAEVHIDVSNTVVNAHPHLHLAIHELVENAIIHSSSQTTPEVGIYTESKDGSLILKIEDNGPGLPKHESGVLESEKETTLEHSSGIGLWLAHWIINYSSGELETELTDGGTLINIHLKVVHT